MHKSIRGILDMENCEEPVRWSAARMTPSGLILLEQVKWNWHFLGQKLPNVQKLISFSLAVLIDWFFLCPFQATAVS
jgi:hypothetical protein